MRLDFNVLWVEDQPHNVADQRDRIDFLLRKEGFRFQVLFATTISEAVDYLRDEVYGDNIDLVLMDYDLGIGGKGDDGLLEVRNNFRFKDIVFYSSGASDLPRLVAEKRVQGVFCSTRNELPDTVDGVFEALIKKVLDIDHSRGIVMGATSDIDYSVAECIEKSFDFGDEQHKQFAFECIRLVMEEKCEQSKSAAKKLAKIKHISGLKKFSWIYGSKDKLNLLQNLLIPDQSYQDIVEKIEEYKEITVPKRNKLAHTQVVNGDGFSRKLVVNDGTELDAEYMKLLRQDLLKIQEHFDQLLQKLSSNQNSDLD